MRKMKKAYMLLPIILCIAALFLWSIQKHTQGKVTGKELLINGDFNTLAEDGLPEAWYSDAYYQADGYTSYERIRDASLNGQYVMHITNHEMNDARIAQTVAVEPNSLYCLSGLLKAKTEGGRGANLSIEGVYTFSNCLYDTADEWQQVTLYGRTDNNQKSMTIFARLGGYSGETKGEAWFSNLSLKKVSEAPSNAIIGNFFPTDMQQSQTILGIHRFDLRHLLLILFTVQYGILLIGFIRHRSVLGMLILVAVSTLLSFFAALSGQMSEIEVVRQYTTPLPYVKFIFWGIEIITLSATIWLVLDISRQHETMKLPAMNKSENNCLADEHKNATKRYGFDWKDWAVMLTITALYACLAYTNLGATTSPQTSFVFTDSMEQVTFDLGEHKEDFRMLYMGGIHEKRSDFSIQISDDNLNWSEPIGCEMDVGMLFQWKYVNSYSPLGRYALTARYVRVTAEHPGLTLFETLFRDAQGKVFPVKITDSLGRNASALVDEQFTLQGEPGWYNSMYFDEIYHARTAYEHLHGLPPYEISHPPLGKVFMSWCIAIFGMTPFGWRFAGATCGVLMLPGMYLLGKLLFTKRRYAILTCLLMTLDTMHFTQTRIATIDSFVVLFIIWAVYFMLRWFYVDFFGQKLWKTMVPLGLSGLCMGLAIASKWPGCYAGVGLAAVFFFGIGRRWKAVQEARALPADQRDHIACVAANSGTNRLLITVASCLIFFILVPLLIYWCSYIPYFAPEGGVTVRRIVDAAKTMFAYHALPGRGMDHHFYSPWYQWPLSEKPMYYAAPNHVPAGFTYAILAFGNYAVWWVGFLSLLITIYAYCRHQLYPILCVGYQEKITILAPRRERDERPALLLICFAAQFIPWLFVPRGTYIYHYFPSVPFIILCTAYVFERWNDWLVALAGKRVESNDSIVIGKAEKRMDKYCFILLVIYLLIVAGMFIAFFPPASGILVRREWMDAVNWFHNLYY